MDILFNFVTSTNYYILLFFFFVLNFYYFISISNILKTLNINLNNQKILNLELYNKSISSAYDETRTFKHDSNNIFQALSGYITNNDFNGLKEYFWQVFPEIKNINNLVKLNPTLVNNPAIYGLLAEKHFKAEKYNVTLNLDIMLDLNTLNMKIFELTRILGILVDNAIETAKDCSEKKVNVCFKKGNNRQILIVENTYSNKDVCIDKIFEKGYSTKPNNTGLGLWEVRKILNKNSNLNLYTSKTNDYFMQQLEIY
ncbi:MAG: sensor histidine kinase [Candidatus Scatovivens sp.]